MDQTPKNELSLEMTVYITYNNGGHPVITIRKVIQEPQKMRYFLDRLLDDKTEIYAKIIFRDRFKLLAKAKQMDLF